MNLKGSLNEETQKYEVVESYRGKITGKMKISLDKDLTLHAEWQSPKDKENVKSFVGELIDLPNNKKQNPTFTTYTFDHKIEVFNSEKDDFDLEDSSDDCKMMRVGQAIVFVYSVNGHNYHSGGIDGTIKLDKDNKGIFTGDEGCEMSFEIRKNELIIEELQSCEDYKGYRAYFGGTLIKN